MELPGSAYLYTLATLSMTFAGFSAVVIVLCQTIQLAVRGRGSFVPTADVPTMEINRAPTSLQTQRRSCGPNHISDKRLSPDQRRTPRTPSGHGDAADQQCAQMRSL